MAVFLRTRLLEKWFFEVRAWEESESADGSIRWVCMKGVPIPLWNNQFFSFGNPLKRRRIMGVLSELQPDWFGFQESKLSIVTPQCIGQLIDLQDQFCMVFSH